MKKKRRRLRVDRIIYVLAIIILLFFLIKFTIYTILNTKIYNAAKSSDTIKVYSSEPKLWEKTINYIKDTKDNITIKYKNNFVTIDSDSLKNEMNIKLNTYNKKINEPLFNNVKSYYIENNSILNKSSKIKVKLPRYLYKKSIVDIYKVKDKKIELYKASVEVKDKFVAFKTNKNEDYFITYIELENIKSKSIEINKGDTESIKVTYVPSNATSTSLKYKVKDTKIASIKGSKVTGLKAGSTTITIYSEKDGVSKDISLKVKKKTSSKTEKKEEQPVTLDNDKIEVIDGITYVDGIMIVNKTYSLPSTYDPGKLTDEFMDAFEEMQAAAALDNINLFIASGYRSYDYQVELYDKYVRIDGKEQADTYSARPGHSEHQTGLTADINSADESFEDTPEALWLDKNCYKYGFIVRYPKGKEKYTGYEYEPWHLRYIGKEKAKIIYESGLSLEEYYGLKSEYID